MGNDLEIILKNRINRTRAYVKKIVLLARQSSKAFEERKEKKYAQDRALKCIGYKRSKYSKL